MTDSILDTIKDSIGVAIDERGFDQELILPINAAIMELVQLGVEKNVIVTGPTQTWSLFEEFYADDSTLEAIKLYISMKVKLIFDPPSNSFVVDSARKLLEELAWRIMVQSDYNKAKKEGADVDCY